MPGLMKTFDALPGEIQAVARAMSDAARVELEGHGIKPLNDDRAAVFDEACAVYLNERLIQDGDPRAVR